MNNHNSKNNYERLNSAHSAGIANNRSIANSRSSAGSTTGSAGSAGSTTGSAGSAGGTTGSAGGRNSAGGGNNKFDERKGSLLSGVRSVCILIAAVAVIFFGILGVTTVSGNSMLPTYKDGELVIFLRHTSDYRYGDIVVVKVPNGDEYIKRVVAVPGQTVDIRDGKLYVDGVALSEDYIRGVTKTVGDAVEYPVTLEDEQYFVLGDNRENSVDSRTIGPVYLAQLRGRILVF